MSGWDDYCSRCASQNQDIKYLAVFGAAPFAPWGCFTKNISVDPSCVANIINSLNQDETLLHKNGIMLQEGDVKKYLYVKSLPFDSGSCVVARLKNSSDKEHLLMFQNQKNVLVCIIGESMTSYEGAEYLNRIAITL